MVNIVIEDSKEIQELDDQEMAAVTGGLYDAYNRFPRYDSRNVVYGPSLFGGFHSSDSRNVVYGPSLFGSYHSSDSRNVVYGPGLFSYWMR